MNKKFAIYLVFLFLVNVQVNSQTPNWAWAKSIGGFQFDYAATVTTDKNGNILFGGHFNSATLVFDTITLTATTTISDDLYVAKYNSNGNVLWAKSATGNQYDGINSVATDSSGNVYAGGYFRSSSINFGSISLTNANLDYHALLVKYDSVGNVLWARSSTGNDGSITTAIAVDVSGNIYMAGHFGSAAITFGTTTLINDGSGTDDIFIAKYDSSGNVLWVKGYGGKSDDEVNSITTDASFNIYAVGNFGSNTLIFGSDTLLNPIANTGNLFVVKIDSSGNTFWAKDAGVGINGNNVANSVITDNTGNLFVTGRFGGDSTWFDNIVLHNHLGPGPYYDMFIVKYDSNGNAIWAHGAGGTDYDEGYSVTSDYSGNIYVSGHFQSPSISFGSFTVNNNSNLQMFVVKYDNNGNALWATTTSSGNGYPYSLTAGGVDDIYVIGVFWNPSITFGSTTLTNVFYSDIFLAKLNATTGISEEYSNDIFQSPYPNPFSSSLSIKETNQNGEIILYDLTSRKLLQQSFTNSTSINTSHLSKGIYIYELRNKNEVIKKGKVIKD